MWFNNKNNSHDLWGALTRLRMRIALAGVMASTLFAAGCTVPVEEPGPTARRKQEAPPAAVFRDRDVVEIVEETSETGYVRVKSRDRGDTFYIHQEFVREQDGEHVVVTAANIFDKDLTADDQYLTLKELGSLRAKIPALFRTHPSGHEVVAPRKAVGPFVYEGELAWPVYECQNPDCPERSELAEDEPVLYIRPNPNWTVADLAKSPGQKRKLDSNASNSATTLVTMYLCPHCLAIPGRDENDPQYIDYVRRYTLPEAQSMSDSIKQAHQRGLDVRRRLGKS